MRMSITSLRGLTIKGVDWVYRRKVVPTNTPPLLKMRVISATWQIWHGGSISLKMNFCTCIFIHRKKNEKRTVNYDYEVEENNSESTMNWENKQWRDLTSIYFISKWWTKIFKKIMPAPKRCNWWTQMSIRGLFYRLVPERFTLEELSLGQLYSGLTIKENW